MGGRKSCLPRVLNPHPRGRIILSSICNTSFQFLLLQSLPIADPAPRNLQDALQRGHKVHGQLTAPSHPPPRPHAHPSLCAQRPHQYTLRGGQRYIFSVCGGPAGVHPQAGPALWSWGPGVPRPRCSQPPSQCLISRMEGLWSRMARMILSMYCRSRKLISSCSLRASMSSSREAVSISEAKDCALVWVAKRFFAS